MIKTRGIGDEPSGSVLNPLQIDNREFKHDIYGRRQMAKPTSDFLSFSCNLETNYTKMENCLVLFTANTNVLIPLYRALKADGKSFIFAVCCLP